MRAWICRLTCLQELSYPLTRYCHHHRCYSRRREPNTTRSMERAYEPPVAGWRRPGQLRRGRPRRPSLLPLLYSCALFLRNHHLWLLHHLLLVLILVYLGWQQLDLEKKPPLGRCRHPWLLQHLLERKCPLSLLSLALLHSKYRLMVSS